LIKSLLPSPIFMRHMQPAMLVFLTMPVFNMAWAEAENSGAKTDKRLSDIPYITCFNRSAERYEVDLELAIAVAIVESSLNPEAVSSSEAIGVMQIKWPLTAEHLGITQRELLFDPCINIDAGVSYLKELIDKNAEIESTDPLIQALGSYHLGPTTIANAEEFPQKAADYAEAVFKQRDILAEGNTTSEQITDQISEESANAANNAEREPAEETSSLIGSLETTEESGAQNGLQENLANELTSTNAFSNQTLDLTGAGQQSADRVQAKPINPCSTAGVRSLLLSTHNPGERGEKFSRWLEKTGINCTELQLLKLRNNLPVWLGTTLDSELLGSVEILLEEKSLQP
jgi:hypothetical protein